MTNGKTEESMTPMNKTLVKNMKHVKWKEIPPLKGPEPQGLNVPLKQVKTVVNSRDKINGKRR
tara:strand:+ start:176 stop:364 length:189 start_codon:yes stop_codon:yes gene_type:complete